MRASTRLAIVGGLFLLFCVAIAHGAPGDAPKAKVVADAEIDIEGLYELEGTEDGSSVRGVAVVSRIGDAYSIQFLTNGGFTQSVGVRTGDTLSTAWNVRGPNGQPVVGTTLYQITKKAGAVEMSGKWVSMPGNGKIHRERLNFIRSLPQPVEKE